jgi:hypothetical protein
MAAVTGVLANVLSAAVFGIAAFAQPAIGRDYLAGHTAQARLLVSTAETGGWLNVTAITRGVLLAASVVVARVAVARTGSLPQAAGIGFAISIVLYVSAPSPATRRRYALKGTSEHAGQRISTRTCNTLNSAAAVG